MTPALIRREIDKLPPDIPVWIFHVKPQFHEEIAEELARIDSSRVSIPRAGSHLLYLEFCARASGRRGQDGRRVGVDDDPRRGAFATPRAAGLHPGA